MIRFVGDLDGGNRKLIGLGLSEENIKRLRKGEPILVRGDEIGFSDMDITIFYGETEEVMYQDLKKAGLVT